VNHVMRKLLSEEPMTGTRISQSGWTGTIMFMFMILRFLINGTILDIQFHQVFIIHVDN